MEEVRRPWGCSGLFLYDKARREKDKAMTTENFKPKLDDGVSSENGAAQTSGSVGAGDSAASSMAGSGGIESRVAALETELAETRDRMLRALAEVENTRSRARREREDAGKYAISGFARDLLTVSDNLRRALEAAPAESVASAVIQGIEATERELLKVLEKHGIRKLDPVGQAFDPNFHEVMFEAPLPGKPSGSVFQVLEHGYVIGDRLLRPARVGVVKNDSEGGGPSAPSSSSSSGHNLDTQA